MTLDEIQALQLRLPAGIKIVLNKGTIHYMVRSSRHGKKFSLGTFLELDDAINALVKFKTQVMHDSPGAHPGAQVSSKAPKITYEEATGIFDEIGVHMLSSGKPYNHMKDDGSMLEIPAKYVDMYIHVTYYGALPEDVQEPKGIQATDL